ncbi:hypothetical protein QBC47DRAFT_395496 [Echria macrotheca]|uniref:Exonuclease domain-containing protein n=1 Tax=Echria macrotheca TaxID=438768 RepID=A0AAJ0B1X1_9PEZI|nr:hypothetical protein QBC47DRAFT_395496 [Echria macrotheca]
MASPGSPAPDEYAIIAIAPSPAYLDVLDSLVPSIAALKKAGHITAQLTDQQLDEKKRCVKCNARPLKTRIRDRRPAATVKNAAPKPANASTKKPEFCCKFHPGEVKSKIWSCCGQHVSHPPCGGSNEHQVEPDPENRLIRERWEFEDTPIQQHPDHRIAVAIDCEMGTARDGESELIRVTIIDYFSGTTLLDSLVYPDVPMLHYNTKYSGIRAGDMEKARRSRECIFGKTAARAAIFRYVGPATVVIGHGMQSDLVSLRWIHHRVVDSFLLESGIRQAQKEAEEKAKKKEETKVEEKAQEGQGQTRKGRGKGHPDGMSLQALAKKRLGRSIQTGYGHDSLEDARAARDLVHLHIEAAIAARMQRQQPRAKVQPKW